MDTPRNLDRQDRPQRPAREMVYHVARALVAVAAFVLLWHEAGAF